MIPSNYQDLFDQVYPLQQIVGLTDESEITVEELNKRLATIRTNVRSTMRAINGFVAKSAPGEYMREYVGPFGEVVAARRFVYTALQKQNHRFRTGFDAVGEPLSFGVPMTVFSMADLGGTLFGENYAVLVFNNRRLVAPSKYTASAVQGGAVVYLTEADYTADQPVDVIILRKFNERGTTYAARPTSAVTAGAASHEFVADLQDLGRVFDLHYYHLYRRPVGKTRYLPMDSADFAIRTDTNDSNVVVTANVAVVNGDSFQLVCTAEYWTYELSAPGGIALSDPRRAKIDLIMPTGTDPAPLRDAKDLDVYLDGRLLRPDVDYEVLVQGGTCDAFRLLVRNLPGAGVPFHLYAVTGAPYDAEYAIEATVAGDSEAHGIIPVPEAGRATRLMRGLGMTWSDGGFSGGPGPETVGVNRALYLPLLPGRANPRYRFRPVLTKDAKDLIDSQSGYRSDLEQFIDLSAVDYVAAYITTSGAPTIPAGSAMGAWPTGLGGLPLMYLWAAANPFNSLDTANQDMNSDPAELTTGIDGCLYEEPVSGMGAMLDFRPSSAGPGYPNIDISFRPVP